MRLIILVLLLLTTISGFSQYRLVTLGTSTTAGLATSSPDSGWVRRLNHYYKYQLTVLDTVFNLGISGRNLYHAMPGTYTPPAGRPSSDPLNNVSRANHLLSGTIPPANGVVIINFPTGGYDTYSIAEIMSALQLMYDSAIRNGNRCYVTTTQPRVDAGFNTSAIKRKLADLKDSILNRFGAANTINFWDGMFNPVDTTIATPYSAGDDVHFNNAGHRILFERVKAKNIFNLPAPSYRSNVNPTGLWSNASSWQVYNGTAWVTASEPPSAGSGTITILTGDSIRINGFTEIDELTIEPNGILSIFNTASTAKAVATVINGPGSDIVNNGKLYISSNGVLNGNGTFVNNLSGNFFLRNRGVLEITGINDGNMTVTNTGIIRNKTFTNNKTIVLQDFTLQLIASTFINNDSMSIVSGATTFVADSTLAGGFFINSATGVIARHANTGITNFNPSIRMVNNGRIKGHGEFVFYNTITNNGIIQPGNNIGTLKINPSFISGKTPLIDIEINSTGAQPGVNYDNLILSDITPATKNMTGVKLRVTDRGFDPIGSVYSIISPLSGTISGNFAEVTLSPGLTGPGYNNGTSISVTKSSVVPVKLIGFTAKLHNKNTVKLNWETAQEVNAEKFLIEHSTNGVGFVVVGTKRAAGNSDVPQQYEFVHENPNLGLTNYYRLRQVDIDGRQETSPTQTVALNNNDRFITWKSGSTVRLIEVEAEVDNLRVYLYDMAGKILRRWTVNQGRNLLETGNMISGPYVVAVFLQGQRVQTERVFLK